MATITATAATLLASPVSPAIAGDAAGASAATAGERALVREADLPAGLGLPSRVERRWLGAIERTAVCGRGMEDVRVPVEADGGYTWFTFSPGDGGFANVGVRVRLFPTAADASRAWSRILRTAQAECTIPQELPWTDDSETRIGDIRAAGTVRAGASTAAITLTSAFVDAETGAVERTGTGLGVWRRSGPAIVEVLGNRIKPGQQPMAWTPSERAAIVDLADLATERARRAAERR